MDRTYIAIDLKSFYASVECRDRRLNPLTTNLVVADSSRTEKTICLAVSPSLKSYGIPGRARLFEVIQKVKEVNYQRKLKINNRKFIGKSFNNEELQKNKKLELDFITAKPRMSRYMAYSTKIYDIYLKYIAPEDIYVYSIDEVFCDITNYLKTYKLTPKELVTKIILDIYNTTGITATAGIGTNLYLCKVAMDIVAKHEKANEYGVRIAQLNEKTYRELLWSHKPITDFWRVGKGYAKKLEANKIYTMGDIARCSIKNEDLLYKLFGVNAELLIDHSWGWENVTIESIKEYKPENKSLSSGQVLHCPYNYEKTRLIIKEMVESQVLDLIKKNLVTDQLVLHIEYDIENLNNKKIKINEFKIDRYGRTVPKPAHGTYRLPEKTKSLKEINNGFLKLYDEIINRDLLIRKVNLTVGNLSDKDEKEEFKQINLFDSTENLKKTKAEEKIQKTIIDIKNKYGKNAIIKAKNLQEGATAIQRNNQIGGHSE